MKPGPLLLLVAAVLAGAARAASAPRTLNLALIAPGQGNNDRNLPHILPAMDLAIRAVSHPADGILPGWSISLRHRDSQCSSTYGPLAAFDFVMNRTVAGSRGAGLRQPCLCGNRQTDDRQTDPSDTQTDELTDIRTGKAVDAATTAVPSRQQ
ncbi:hypothetical protein FOCC_FOCC008095 [Frankliniella occidentalis]|nr:hypothetical protein FOCC_FOCC008095 [Frankliniella occidentalis]